MMEVPQIKCDQIRLGEFLGAGAFGEVHGGVLIMNGSGQYERVAIKVNVQFNSFRFLYAHCTTKVGLDNQNFEKYCVRMIGTDFQSNTTAH